MLKNDRSKVEINQRLKILSNLIPSKDQDQRPSELDEILVALKEGRINEGENLLFDYLEEGGVDVLKVGIVFYDRLNTFSDEELKKMDFSRREIREGLDDLMEFYGLGLS